MIRRIFTAVLLTIVSLAAYAAPRTLLWRISQPGSPHVSYLLGTHHIAPVVMIDSIHGLREALAGVDAVYGEIAADKLLSPRAQQLMLAAAQAPADSTLTDLLTAAQLARIDSLTGLPGASRFMAQMKPAMIETQLTLSLTRQACPQFDPMNSFDVEVMRIASSGGKPVRDLETIESQIDLLLGTPVAFQAESLKALLDDPDGASASVGELSEAYLAGDLDRLYQAMLASRTYAEIAQWERMVSDRNRAWADILVTVLPAENILIAVGAGHLPGDDGMIELLRRAGFTVEPVQ